MKLNADVGEGVSDDEEIFRWIDMANVACGAHAGGLEEMTRAVDLAVTYGVSVGAHPGYADREAFGRKSVALEPGEITRLVREQVAALDRVCRSMGTRVQYVKPHGALYHDMMERMDVFEEILQAVCEISHDMPVMVLARAADEGEKMLAEKYAVPLLYEAFADRAYDDEGGLLDRGEDGAVFSTVDRMLRQVMELVREGGVTTVGGKSLPLVADTVCVHGDNQASIAAAQKIYHALRS